MATASPIETPRLRLHAHKTDDYESCVALWADAMVVRHIGGKPSGRPQTWARLLNYAGLWAMLGYGYWAIEERATGVFIGEIGFADFKRDIAERMRDVPKIGWALIPSAHGKGYATEAVRAVNSWGDTNLASARTACMITPENIASVRVAEKCEFAQFASSSYNDQPVLFFERYGPERKAVGDRPVAFWNQREK
jgi:RimJ/RimL family protein N-acetyltransferase